MKIYEIINTTPYGDEHNAFVSSKKKAIDYIEALGGITSVRIKKNNHIYNDYISFRKDEETEQDWHLILNFPKGTYEVGSIHKTFIIKVHNVE